MFENEKSLRGLDKESKISNYSMEKEVEELKENKKLFGDMANLVKELESLQKEINVKLKEYSSEVKGKIALFGEFSIKVEKLYSFKWQLQQEFDAFSEIYQ